MSDLIKSISFDQDEILNWILRLYVPDGFDLDPTFSKGLFYRNIAPPRLRFDINPQVEGVEQADCTNLPLDDGSIGSIMFDPPFLAASAATGVMTKRFGYYRTMVEIWNLYSRSLDEFYRVLKPGGVLVFKCQDTIHGKRQHLSQVKIVNQAIACGFFPKDVFVLLAKCRLISSHIKRQEHARKFHSYFLVFIKRQCTINYTGESDVSK